MSFRKRNVGISDGRRPQATTTTTTEKSSISLRLPGTRPSTIDGRIVTSTGVASLDGLFTGHGGQPLGTSVLLEENGTTDYAGALLRFYAAEGLMQGHHVYVVGHSEQWGRELPGVTSNSTSQIERVAKYEKLKIAWRYESLGQSSTEIAGRERPLINSTSTGLQHDDPLVTPFCHSFDISKRLVHPPSAHLKGLSLDVRPVRNCFATIIGELSAALKSTPSNIVHRVIVPSLMSPSIYPPQSSLPEQVLPFQHELRGLLATYRTRLVIIQSLPLSIFPRASGLTKWLEILADGVYALDPFPHFSDAEFQVSRDPQTKEEIPQGLLRIHKLPVLHELGSGLPAAEMDWTFTLSRRKFNIKPFNLPPIETDNTTEQDVAKDKVTPKADLEF